MPKLLYLLSEDWFFCSHFIERAIAAKRAGYEVLVVARENTHAEEIRKAGLRFIALKFRRKGTNPFIELVTIFNIWRIYKEQKPDLIHHIALKPLIYGSFVARLMGIKGVVNAPVGLGYVFTSDKWTAILLRFFITLAIKLLINPTLSKVVFENNDDLNTFVQGGLVSSADAVLIRGAGVNVSEFIPTTEPSKPLVIILIARMLWDKGIGEYVEAAKIIKKNFSDIRFLLIGAPDLNNPACIPLPQLEDWNKEGAVEWLGHQNNVPKMLSQCHVVCLPSYREGLPKSLLEALAAGKPVVTTDVPGCREVVRDKDNGLLVPVKNIEELARALTILIQSPELRTKFGTRGRERAEKEFSSNIVIKATLDVYDELLDQLQQHSKSKL